MVATRTLREELYATFTEELALLDTIKECEEAVALATDDPDAMQTALNRLQELQDLESCKHAAQVRQHWPACLSLH